MTAKDVVHRFDVNPLAVPKAAHGVWSSSMAEAVRGDKRADQISRRALRTMALETDLARRTVSWSIIGAAGHRQRLSFLLGVDVKSCAPKLALAAWFVDQAAMGVDDVVEALDLNDTERRSLELMSARAWPEDEGARAMAAHSIPPLVFDRLRGRYTTREISELFSSMNTPGPLVLRANTARISREELVQTLRARGERVSAGALSPWSVVVATRFEVNTCPHQLASDYAVQDEGSQLIALATCAAPEMRVLDLCAGRGGKTLALSSMVGETGRIDATDVDDDALRTLRARVTRTGATNVRVLPREGVVAGAYDVVLVDAPCSSLGALRRGPDMRYTVTTTRIDALTTLQRALLREAFTLVRVGGRVIYATCSILPDENEGVVASVMAAVHASDVHIARAPVGLVGVSSSETEVTLLPSIHGTDGFFIAAFTRVA